MAITQAFPTNKTSTINDVFHVLLPEQDTIGRVGCKIYENATKNAMRFSAPEVLRGPLWAVFSDQTPVEVVRFPWRVYSVRPTG